MQSLDPRVNRINLATPLADATDNTHLITYEVFHQEKRGKQAVHVGIVHASTPEMALIVAKEQYARRGKTTNLWVAKSSDIYTYSPQDDDIFDTVVDKQFREPGYYKVRDKIEAYQKRNKVNN